MRDAFPWMSHRSMDKVLEVEQIVDQIKPILAGHLPGPQGAALGDCVAIWLAGHRVADNPAATEKLRSDLLGTFCDLVRRLVAINEILSDEPIQ